MNCKTKCNVNKQYLIKLIWKFLSKINKKLMI